MALQVLNSNSVQPLGLPNTGTGTDEGDLWNAAVTKLNAMMTELYGRTGGTGTLNSNLPSSALLNFRNMLDGGDATLNPFQRGTTISNVGATNTYTADRFFLVGGNGSSAALAQVSNSSVPGFSNMFQLSRAQSAGGLSPVILGQALETADSIKAQGQPVCFSFWLAANTGYLNNQTGLINATVTQGFGTNQSASALANATWTSQSNVISANVAPTSTPTRVSFTGTVSNTATQLGVLLQYTPTTTAATAEQVNLWGLQLEVLGNANAGPSQFEHRDIEVELALCQRYFFQINEGGTGSVVGAGMAATTNGEIIFIPLPVQMRAAPTVTVTAGSFAFNVGGSVVAASGLAAGTTHTPNYISLIGTATAVSGQACLLQSRSLNSGLIAVSADL